MSKSSVRFVCQNCGADYPKWMGRCASCGEWNTLTEERISRVSQAEWMDCISRQEAGSHHRCGFSSGRTFLHGHCRIGPGPGRRHCAGIVGIARRRTGSGQIDTFDAGSRQYRRGLRAGFVCVGRRILGQLKLRAQRLDLLTERLIVLSESDVETIGEHLASLKPKLAIIDSIQTMYMPDLGSAPGSVGQVREAAAYFLRLAKSLGVSIVLVGHVTKGGALAGPKVLEHAVDYVLYFEGAMTIRCESSGQSRTGLVPPTKSVSLP